MKKGTICLAMKDPSKGNTADNWIEMNSFEAAQFFKTSEGHLRQANFMLLSGCDDANDILIECTITVAKELKSEKDRQYYVDSLKKKLDLKVVSLDAEIEFEDGEVTNHELCADPKVNVEEEAITNLEIEALHEAIDALSPIEAKLIYSLFLADECMTEAAFGEANGLSRDAVHEKKRTALRKLRKELSEKK